MTELLALELVKKRLVTKKMELTINYDRESLRVLSPGQTTQETVYAVSKTGKAYTGTVTLDYYGRPTPKHAHGTGSIDRYTNSTRRIMQAVLGVYDRVVDPELLIRRVNIAAVGLLDEREAPRETPEQLDLFTDYEALEKQREAEQAADEKEKKIQRATLLLQSKYGKNAVLKGMNLLEGGTTIERNGQIGGHRAGE
jgi:DNA polymerase V